MFQAAYSGCRGDAFRYGNGYSKRETPLNNETALHKEFSRIQHIYNREMQVVSAQLDILDQDSVKIMITSQFIIWNAVSKVLIALSGRVFSESELDKLVACAETLASVGQEMQALFKLSE